MNTLTPHPHADRPTPVGRADATEPVGARERRPAWRARATAAGLVLTAVSLAACSSTSAAPATSSTPSTTTPTTAFGWLKTVAEPWNHKLNADQLQVLDDSKPTSTESSSTFFSRLDASCTQMLNDAQQSGQIPRAPSASLDAAWRRMATETVTYASDCVTVAKGQSTSDLTTWTTSLQAMDSANAAFNAAVKAVRPEAPGSTTTTSTVAG